ncbi:unnamed protein product [Closterium sp. Yama58-4]|nr:unnamed protein product [Closterium sp. Yama58-4]
MESSRRGLAELLAPSPIQSAPLLEIITLEDFECGVTQRCGRNAVPAQHAAGYQEDFQADFQAAVDFILRGDVDGGTTGRRGARSAAEEAEGRLEGEGAGLVIRQGRDALDESGDVVMSDLNTEETYTADKLLTPPSSEKWTRGGYLDLNRISDFLDLQMAKISESCAARRQDLGGTSNRSSMGSTITNPAAEGLIGRLGPPIVYMLRSSFSGEIKVEGGGPWGPAERAGGGSEGEAEGGGVGSSRGRGIADAAAALRSIWAGEDMEGVEIEGIEWAGAGGGAGGEAGGGGGGGVGWEGLLLESLGRVGGAGGAGGGGAGRGAAGAAGGRSRSRGRAREDLGGGLILESLSSFSSAHANVCVYAGRWQYEATLGSSGIQQIGWATLACPFTAEEGVGDAPDSYAFDGKRVRKWSGWSAQYGQPWAAHDVIGVMDLLHLCLEEHEWSGIIPALMDALAFHSRTSLVGSAALTVPNSGAGAETVSGSGKPPEVWQGGRDPYPYLSLACHLAKRQEVLSAWWAADGFSTNLEAFLTRKVATRVDLQRLFPSLWWPGCKEEDCSAAALEESKQALVKAMTRVELCQVSLCRSLLFFVPSKSITGTSSTYSLATGGVLAPFLRSLIRKNRAANRNIVPPGLSDSSVLVTAFFVLLRLLWAGLVGRGSGKLQKAKRGCATAAGHGAGGGTAGGRGQADQNPLPSLLLAFYPIPLPFSPPSQAALQQQGMVQAVAQLEDADRQIAAAMGGRAEGAPGERAGASGGGTAGGVARRGGESTATGGASGGGASGGGASRGGVGGSVRAQKLREARQVFREDVDENVRLAVWWRAVLGGAAWKQRALVGVSRRVSSLLLAASKRRHIFAYISFLLTRFSDARIANPDTRDQLLQTLSVLLQLPPFSVALETNKAARTCFMPSLLNAFDQRFWIPVSQVIRQASVPLRVVMKHRLFEVLCEAAPEVFLPVGKGGRGKGEMALEGGEAGGAAAVAGGGEGGGGGGEGGEGEMQGVSGGEEGSRARGERVTQGEGEGEREHVEAQGEATAAAAPATSPASATSPVPSASDSSLDPEMNRMRLFELLLFILNHTCSGADARALDGVLQAHVSPSDQSSRPMVLAPLVGIVGGLFSHALRANGSAPAGMVRSVLQADPSLDCLAGLGYLLGFDWVSWVKRIREGVGTEWES